MACVDVPANADSEMEEGEIVDEVDYLSDISSEEEFLLRQRLKVLENYNNALERKEAKRSTIGSGNNRNNDLLYSDISGTDAEDNFLKTKFVITKDKKHARPHHKPVRPRRPKLPAKDLGRNKDRRKKYKIRYKTDTIRNSIDSDGTDDDIKVKRRKLADAVALNIIKHDTTSTLKERLTKMLRVNNMDCDKEAQIVIPKCLKEKENKPEQGQHEFPLEYSAKIEKNSEDLAIKDDKETVEITQLPHDVVDSPLLEKKEENNNSQENSDEDLELLRQHALKTKSAKPKSTQQKDVCENKTAPQSEDEDSDTAELRMICLKSTLLKKAIEMKQKQKLQKRLSNSTMHDFDIGENDMNIDNHTDIESVDMEMGSDAEDKGKELIHDFKNVSKTVNRGNCEPAMCKEDELEEDEDLLRAKLLTSLSKNLPNLVDINVLDSAFAKEGSKKVTKKLPNKKLPPQPSVKVEEKKFIIKLGESDSEGENEATKNLTKMHQKLSEEAEFQQKLDQFLKSTRMEVEKKKLPDVVQDPVAKPPEKIVVKTMNHLPKSEQIEYRNLVKRMAELEKMKQARQLALNTNSRNNAPKDTLKPRNFAMNTHKLVFAKRLEEKIALSRKNIAEESAKMLKLKEEATKLTQRYKIVASELKNIATAITLNKKHQKTLQNGLNKIRHQHQMLLKSAPIKHSNQILRIERPIDTMLPAVKLQKENEPIKDASVFKSDKVSLASDLNKQDIVTNPSLTIQVDVSNNKKLVLLPKNSPIDRIADIKKHSQKNEDDTETVECSATNRLRDERNSRVEERLIVAVQDDFKDYKSPLESLNCKNWEEDPNAVLCPFEFGGSCRDPDCRYLHPKILKQE